MVFVDERAARDTIPAKLKVHWRCVWCSAGWPMIAVCGQPMIGKKTDRPVDCQECLDDTSHGVQCERQWVP